MSQPPIPDSIEEEMSKERARTEAAGGCEEDGCGEDCWGACVDLDCGCDALRCACHGGDPSEEGDRP